MKIALIGYGKMGKAVEEAALASGHQIVAKISPSLQCAIDQKTLADADVCIDFSRPESVLQNIRKISSFKKNIVMGTTGWYEQLDDVKKIVSESGIGFLYAPNFSIGVHLFLKIVREAAKLMNNYFEYDVGVTETHHRQKIDSPSGTANAIAEELLKHIERKNKIETDASQKPPCPNALHIASLRCGHIPGSHSVYFDSLADTINLTHDAKGRMGFAAGSVRAAEWLVNKKGIFTLDDMDGL